MILLGIFALILNYANIPVSPVILGFVLGYNIEVYLRKGYSYSGGTFAEFFKRPVSAIFLLIAIFSIVWNVIGPIVKEKRQKI